MVSRLKWVPGIFTFGTCISCDPREGCSGRATNTGLFPICTSYPILYPSKPHPPRAAITRGAEPSQDAHLPEYRRHETPTGALCRTDGYDHGPSDYWRGRTANFTRHRESETYALSVFGSCRASKTASADRGTDRRANAINFREAGLGAL